MRKQSFAVLALLLVAPLFANGQKEVPPSIPLDSGPTVFVAPANPEAKTQALTLPFAPVATEGQVIKSWVFRIYSASGTLVATQSDVQTLDRGFFGELFNLGPRPSATIPSALVWDGKDSEGKVVSNGVYTYVLTVTDSRGLSTQSAPYQVVVQNTPVAITKLSADTTIFSPKGKRPTLTIRQSGTRESQWTGVFSTLAGVAVRTYSWANPTNDVGADVAPSDFDWDGKDDAGQILPDGEYRYTLSGTNRAGATATLRLEAGLVISDKPGVLRLSSDQGAFSPTADKGYPQVLNLKPDAGGSEGLADWQVTVTDPSAPRVVLWSKAGKAPLPETLTWDGKDLRGKLQDDGRYQAVLTANFSNGNTSASPALVFELDTVDPVGRFTSPTLVFGGTTRPALPAEFIGDGNVDWVVDVLGPDGLKTGPSYTGQAGKVAAEITSLDGTGKPRVDGTYTFRASAHDRAGNLGSATLAVVRDSRPRKITLSPSSQILVPANSTNGSIVLTPQAEISEGVTQAKWSVSSLDAKGAVLKVVDQETLPNLSPWTWPGRDDAGKALADGAYRVALAVTFANGTLSAAQLDLSINSNYLKEPQGQLTVSAPVFGGNERPTVSATFNGDPGLDWTMAVLDSAGKTVGSYPLGKTGRTTLELPADAVGTWADGSYTFRASAQSTAGVTGSVTQTVQKDSRARKVALELSRAVLVPGKGAYGQLRATPLLDVLDGVNLSVIEVRDADGTVVAQQSREGLLTFWDWNGLIGGKAPTDGSYSVSLAVTYVNGAVSRSTSELKVDANYLTEPQGTLTVSAPAFGGKDRPTVTASFSGDLGLKWTLDVVDATGKIVRSVALNEPFPTSVEIGADASGKSLADGTYTLRASAKSTGGQLGTAVALVRKDARNLRAGLDLSSPVLVPGNALTGTVKITPVLDVLDSIDRTQLSIVGPAGNVVDARGGDGLVPFWDWDGKDPQGKLVADGDYQLKLSVAYANGTVSAATAVLKLDSTFLKEPKGTLSASDSVYGGSGRAGVTVSFTGDAGVVWSLDILGADGKVVIKKTLGDSGKATFDVTATGDAGTVLPDGPYTVRASAVSKGGVSGTALLQLRKDSRAPKVGLDLSRTVLVPGKGANGAVRITPLVDAVDLVDKSVLSILGPDGKVVGERTAAGSLGFWDWNGTNAAARSLGNGQYEVALTVNYANGAVSRASGQIKIDSTYLNDQGPLVEMTLSSKTFAPNNVDGATDLTVSIKTTEGVVPVDNWSLVAIDPRGKAFRSWSGKGLPPKSIYWDGKSETGEVVESGEDYQLQLRVSDTQKNVTRSQATVTIDIAVVKIAEGKYKIVVSSIQFPGNSSDLFKLPPELLDKNLYVLKRLANALGKFPGYKIRLEGYAVSEFWNDARAAAQEQRTQLIPLSLDRAQSVRAALVLLGIEPERFTVLGLGGDKPIVPHGDVENRWKNRRVEFYLDKN